LIGEEGQRTDVEALVREQVALRRIASLASEGVPDADLFACVAEEIAKLFDASTVTLDRYDGDSSVVLADWPESRFPDGSRWPLEGDSLLSRVLATGEPARIDDYSHLSGPVAAAVRRTATRSAVGAPIIVGGDVWGLLCVGTPEPTPPDTEFRLAAFTQLLATAIVSSEARGRLGILMEEHAALRRVAILVAEGTPPSILFNAVAEEVARLFDVAAVTLSRYERDECVVLADPQNSGFSVDSRWPLDGESLAARVFATGKPARIDDYSSLPGAIAEQMRSSPSASAVGVPIVVDASVWGVLTVGTSGPNRMPVDTVERVVGFTELVATALANAEARGHVRDLVAEQAALRRVATLVAEDAPAAALLQAVAKEAGRVFGVATVTVGRYGAGPSFTVVAASSDAGLPVGSKWPLDGPSMARAVFDGKGAARIDDYSSLQGTIAAAVRSTEILSAVGSPIVVDGSVWGFISVSPTNREEPLPRDTEGRLEQFTELVATAIANSQARDNVRALVDEQTALRRLAVLVAEDAPPVELFSAVAEEAGHVLGVPGVSVDRFAADGAASTVVATWGVEPFPVGTEWPVEEGTAAWTVFHTGAPARVDDYSRVQGKVAGTVQDVYPDASIVGVPIVVEGRVWGMIGVGTPWPGVLPADTEVRLSRFTDLVATAISNSEAREVKRTLADEQAALRRVATLVAEGATAAELCTAVAEEVGRVVGVPGVTIDRYEPDGSASVVLACWHANGDPWWPVGSRWPVDPGTASWDVYHTGRPARLNGDSYASAEGAIADALRSLPRVSVVAVPIEVDGKVWGIMGVAEPEGDPLPVGTEERLTGFTELVATAISNADAHDRLRRVGEEQAALRRVATLVAREAPGSELFSMVAEEIAKVLDVPVVTIDRYESDRATTVLAAWSSIGQPDYESGSRWPLDEGPSVAGLVLASGQAARIDDYSDLPGIIAEQLHHLAHASSVGVPIVVDGAVWGLICVGLQDQGVLPADTEARLTRFTDLVATAISNADARERLRGISEEQAALRRVATLVAEGAPTAALFSAVAAEVGHVVGVSTVAVGRYAPGPSFTIVAGSNLPDFPVGSRWPLDGPSMAKTVFDGGRAARVDDYSDLPGTVAEAIRSSPILSAVGAPIIVDGSVWGYISVSATDPEPLPIDTEERLEEFTELLATAIARSESRDALALVADEQAALRRVATLVARGAPSSEVFDAVATEVGKLLNTDTTVLGRYDGDGSATAIASWSVSPGGVPVGTRSAIGGHNVLSMVAETGEPARVDGYDDASGEAADIARAHGWQSSIAAPIMVEGRLWGVMLVATQRAERFPVGAEERLAAFTYLVATALANAQAHDEVHGFGVEQAALRRVATLVAEGATTTRLCTAVIEEVVGVFDAPAAWFVRYEPDEWMCVMASLNDPFFPVGSRWPLEGESVTSTIFRTGQSARIDDFTGLDGAIAARTRDSGFVSSLGVPIMVDGTVWGALCVGTTDAEPLPADTEERLGRFTDLVATAISNLESRDRVTQLVGEQSALHRVAELVARGTDSTAVFDAVCEETCRLVSAALVNLVQFTSDGFSVTVAGWSLHGEALLVGTRYPLAPGTLGWKIAQTGAPALMETDEVSVEELASFLREHRVRTRMGAPVVVEGKLWGALIAATTDAGESLPPGTEERLASFTELIATAISNAASRRELIASRARIVAAGDAERRRVERNLHDGIQQRLIALGLDLQAVRSTVSPELEEAHAGFERVGGEVESILGEVRELSRGLHPALLARAGLGPSLRTLARRSPIPVELSVELSERLPDPIEIGAYYVVSEALTNAIKHSKADRIVITVSADDSSLTATIEDDGVGGATAGEGSGILGLADRVEALGGRFALLSPAGGGTRLAVEFPLAPGVDVPSGEY
jgi:GAF domain-containing protein